MADSNLPTRTDLQLPPEDEAVLRQMVRMLEGLQNPDGRTLKFLGSAQALLHPTDERGQLVKAEDHEGAVADALMRAEQIAKSEDVPYAIKKQAQETARSLQATHLAKFNPRAAEQWERLHPAA